MKAKIIIGVLVAMGALAVTTWAQDPADPGVPDTVDLVLTVGPDANANQLNVQVDIYVYNDEDLVGGSSGYFWDNPNLTMDSAFLAPFVSAGWDIIASVYEDNDINTTNANQHFVLGGASLFSSIPAEPSGRRLWASYFFTLSSWSVNDSIVIDTLTFSAGTSWMLIADGQIVFQPIFTGKLVIKDPNQPPPNDPPVLAPIGYQEVTEGQTLNFTVTATDPDETIPSLVVSTLPAGATFTDNGDGSGVFNWTPGFFDAGDYEVTFFAIDAVDPSLVDSEVVQITVIDSNRAPSIVVPDGQPQNVNEGEVLTFIIHGEDEDMTTPYLEAFLMGADTVATNMTFVDSLNGTGVLTFSPDFTQGDDDPTVYTVVFRAVDADDYTLMTESPPYDFSVYNVNRPPEVDGIDDFTVCADESVEMTFTAYDPDDDPLTLWLDPVLENMTFTDQGDGSGIFTFSPTMEQVGLYPTTFFATDGTDTSFVDFVITVMDCSGPAEGKAIILPDFMFAYYHDAVETMMDTIYVGNLAVGHTVEDIDVASLKINGTISPTSTAILESYPGFAGSVLEIVSPIPDFLDVYSPFYDTTVQEFTVFGSFDDEMTFSLTGEVTLRGLISGDVNFDNLVNLEDLTFMVQLLFFGGMEPQDPNVADVDGNCAINVADVTYLVNFLFRGGPKPHCTCKQ